MNVGDVVRNLVAQIEEDGFLKEGNTEVDLESIGLYDKVMISIPFHVDMNDQGEKVLHADGLMVELYEAEIVMEIPDDETPFGPGDLTPKGLG